MTNQYQIRKILNITNIKYTSGLFICLFAYLLICLFTQDFRSDHLPAGRPSQTGKNR